MQTIRRYSIKTLYPVDSDKQMQRYQQAAKTLCDMIDASLDMVRYFSTSGRTEVIGNHTDHQHGLAIGGSVNLDTIAAAVKTDNNCIRVISPGYPDCIVLLDDLSVQKKEEGGSEALIRGVAARLKELGYQIGGFTAVTNSKIPGGSGLSSSAAFELLMCEIIGAFYNDGAIDLMTAAKTAQYAENVYFGKPCGLLDQIACANAGLTYMDFEDPAAPKVQTVNFDFASTGYHLCVLNTRSSHGDLTDDYAAVTREMGAVAKEFGVSYLREVSEEEFLARLPELRGKVNDRSILRALHFFAEQKRVPQLRKAAEEGDFDTYLKTVLSSGSSSYQYLQNVYSPNDPARQAVSLALCLSERILSGRGAWRVHGGGFAGTIQALVPDDLLLTYRAEMERVFGKDTCNVIRIRMVPSCEVTLD